MTATAAAFSQAICSSAPRTPRELTYEELLREHDELKMISIEGQSDGAMALRDLLETRQDEVNRGVALFKRLTLGNLMNVNSDLR